MAPYQIPPTLKTLALTKASAESGDDVFLNKAQGEFDFSTIDFNIICKRELVKTVKPNGIDYIEPEFYAPEEAKELLLCYVKFTYTSPLGYKQPQANLISRVTRNLSMLPLARTWELQSIR